MDIRGHFVPIYLGIKKPASGCPWSHLELCWGQRSCSCLRPKSTCEEVICVCLDDNSRSTVLFIQLFLITLLTSPIWIALTSPQLGPIIESKNGVWWNSTAAEKTIFSTGNPGNSIFFLPMTSQAITLTAELRPSDFHRDPVIKGQW